LYSFDDSTNDVFNIHSIFSSSHDDYNTNEDIQVETVHEDDYDQLTDTKQATTIPGNHPGPNFLDGTQDTPSIVHPNLRRNDCDYSLHDKRLDYIKSGIRDTKINRSEQAMAELLYILRDSPTHIVDDVRSWAQKNHQAISNQRIGLPSRKALLKKALRRYDLTGLLPLNKVVDLIHSDVKANIAIHTLKEAVYSLLMDLRLQDDECFLFHHNDPFGKPFDEEFVDLKLENGFRVIDDINTGRRYWECHAKLCTKDGDVLCPLIFFIDKTHLDKKGNVCLEPLMVTLGIYKRSVRNQPHSWRCIGYVPNQDALPDTATPEGKAADYHAILNVILDELKQLQKEGGIYWEFTYRGKLYKVVFRMPLLFVICDTEGANKLCCKMKFTGRSVNHQCHYCDVSWDELSNPFCKFKYNVDKKFFDHVTRGRVYNWGCTTAKLYHKLHSATLNSCTSEIERASRHWLSDPTNALMHFFMMHIEQSTGSCSNRNRTRHLHSAHEQNRLCRLASLFVGVTRQLQHY
jgi:hypothetical protein